MRTVKLGRSGLTSSVIGLGCMGMSEFYGASDEAELLRTLARALELGITMLDTSDIYGRGHNELLVGRFLRGRRDRVTLASKFGIVRDPDGPDGSAYDRGLNNRPDYMRACCDASLRRLGVETIDLYYVHRLDPSIPVEETVGAMAGLIAAGKIRAIGLSEVSAPILKRANAVHPIAALQSEYSLWTREVEDSVLPTCRELGISLVAYSPLGRGFLTGTIASPKQLADNDFRLTSPRFGDANFERNRALLEKVRALAAAKGCALGQIALAWLLAQGDDVVPIPGTKRVRYLEENAGAAEIDLAPAEVSAIGAAFPPGAVAGTRYDPGFAGLSKA